MSEKLVLIDGHSILNRAFFGLPDLTNAEGLHTNAVYGFLNILFKILEEEQPEYLTVAFDVHAPTFRHKMFDAYKGTRKPMAEELRQQVPLMKEMLRAMGVTVIEKEGLEADDLLGTIAKRSEAAGYEVSVVSGDRDLLQLASDHIKIRIPKTRRTGTEIEDYNTKEVLEKYQVTPLQFIDVKALMGDTADNIPGVPGIGEKTATNLIVAYGSIENAYAHVEEIKPNRAKEMLKEHYDMAQLSKTLATIKIDADIPYDISEARIGNLYTPEAYVMCKRLEFKNLLGRFENNAAATDTKITENFRIIEEKKEFLDFLKKAKKQKEIGLWLITEPAVGSNTKKEELLGAAVSVPDVETVFYALKREQEPEGQLSLFEEVKQTVDETAEITAALQELSSVKGLRIATFDVKRQYDYLDHSGTEQYFDILIAAYLLNPLKNDYDPESIASEHLGIMIPGKAEVFGKRSFRTLLSEEREKAAEYTCYGAWVSVKCRKVLEDKLEAAGMKRLMNEMEMPLSLVLYDMQKEGVAVRREELKSYGDALVARIEELEHAIHEQAGVDFNINSPKQLGEVLFETMQIPGGKKTKTGYSTAADVLEKLSADYPIVRDILEYRGLTKLKSTYADGLAAFIEADGRIHTNFNQTITATGRISSTEPNLQNIPMRMELGRKIRKVFVPRGGYEFMDADYSQIELRVLAHMSGDEQLIDAYRQEEDIHRITASKVFHTPFEEVTDLQRRNAKAVNFGIVYGISSFGLSQDLSISKKEAAQYIEQYFETYPKVKEFIDKLVADAKNKGYTETMFGRRRPIPELSSSNFMQRSFGERVAMNAPIQGTAADIIKIAMIKVWKALKEEGLKSRLILQVHDELLIETALEEEARVREILTENMKSAADLAVTLEIDLHTGKDWYEAK